MTIRRSLFLVFRQRDKVRLAGGPLSDGRGSDRSHEHQRVLARKAGTLAVTRLGLALALAGPATASVRVEWDISAGGNDSNGCGFDHAQAGTDQSLSSSPYVAIDNNLIKVSITGSTVTFLQGYRPSSLDIGNLVQFTGGTNHIPTTYREIVGVGTSTWKLDSSPITSGTTTNATGNMGGSCASIQGALNLRRGSDEHYYVRYSPAPYAINSAISLPPAGYPALPSSLQQCAIVGYHSSHYDNPTGANRPVLLVNGVTGISINENCNWTAANLILNGNGATRGVYGMYSTHYYMSCINTQITNFSEEGFFQDHSVGGSDGPSQLVGCELDHNNVTGGNTAITATDYGLDVAYSWIHDNNLDGVDIWSVATVSNFDHVVFSNNGLKSASSCLYLANGNALNVTNSIFYHCGADGIQTAAGGSNTSHPPGYVFANNIFDANLRHGFNFALALDFPAPMPTFHGNAYFGNGVANAVGFTVSPAYGDVFLSSDPFVNAVGGNFALNSQPGGGALLAGSGYPGALPGLTPSGSQWMGVFRPN
jgi:hypothetical protein